MKPNESGYYHYTDGNGLELIVLVEFSSGSYWMHKFNSNAEEPVSQVKGVFGCRIKLPSEDE